MPGLEGLRNFSDVPLLLQDDLYVPIGFCLTNTLVDFIAVVVAGMNPEGQMLLVIRTTAISPFSTAHVDIAHLMVCMGGAVGPCHAFVSPEIGYLSALGTGRRPCPTQNLTHRTKGRVGNLVVRVIGCIGGLIGGALNYDDWLWELVRLGGPYGVGAYANDARIVARAMAKCSNTE